MNKIFKLTKKFSQKVNFQYKNNNCMAILNKDKSLNAIDLDMIQILTK